MVGIIILNYLNWKLTVECINSIDEDMDANDYKIYIVDNSDESCEEELKSELTSVKYEYIKAENKGYSAGNNIGIKRALDENCEYVLIANNDIIFQNQSISNMKSYLCKHGDVGIVGPKIFLPDNSVQEINMLIKTTLAGKYMYILRKTPLKFLVRKYVSKFSLGKKNIFEPLKVHSVSGCCFMMKRDCAELITPLDENTFLYEEEIIIGMKMEKIKLNTIYLPFSQVTHFHGASTKSVSSFAYICLVESEIYYCREYLRARVIGILPLYFIRTMKFLLISIKNSGYRNDIVKYFRNTTKRLAEKIEFSKSI